MTPTPSDRTDATGLTALLNLSAPRTPLADAVPDGSLHQMVQGTAWEMARGRRRRSIPRTAVIGTVLLLTLGGAGAAAAATLSGWQPWAENPDAVVHFTLPSGAWCEYRIVAKDNTGTAEELSAAKDFLRSTDVLARADIAGELARVTAREIGYGNGQTLVPATQLYSEDQLYNQAVTGAITNVVWDELEASGVISPITGSDLSLASQSDCAGADW